MFVTGDNSKFMASPNITADVEVADKTELYLVAGGKLYSNSMYEISQVNRYINPTMELLPSRNYLDGTVGIRSGIAPGFWFDVFGDIRSRVMKFSLLRRSLPQVRKAIFCQYQ